MTKWNTPSKSRCYGGPSTALNASWVPLEDLVRTREFADAMVVVFKIQVSSREMIELGTRSFLHLWNIPTRSDVQRVSRQLASLEERVRAMTLALERDDLVVRRSRESSDPEPHHGD